MSTEALPPAIHTLPGHGLPIEGSLDGHDAGRARDLGQLIDGDLQ